MSQSASSGGDLRDKIIAGPESILEDPDVMRALVGARESSLGENLVDLRGIALDRLENRLGRLEDTHRSVIAAAYENLAGTNIIHRAVLRLLEPVDFTSFVNELDEVAQILRVDTIRLVLESVQTTQDDTLQPLGKILVTAKKGTITDYIAGPRKAPVRAVTLRQIQPENDEIYGSNADWIRSEALLKLDLGADRLPGMLAMVSEDPHQFKPAQGSDLLDFFGAVFERSMRRWLA